MAHLIIPFFQSGAENNYKTVFAIIGGIWTIIIFCIGYFDNRLKKEIEDYRLVRDYNKELKEWSNNVINLMTTAAHLCLIDPKKDANFYSKRHDLLISLSTELDKGRFFLPNINRDAVGKDKLYAYRGIRKESLSAIFRAYVWVKRIDYFEQKKNIPIKKMIINTKRVFVSELHKEIKPDKFEIPFITLKSKKFEKSNS